MSKMNSTRGLCMILLTSPCLFSMMLTSNQTFNQITLFSLPCPSCQSIYQSCCIPKNSPGTGKLIQRILPCTRTLLVTDDWMQSLEVICGRVEVKGSEIEIQLLYCDSLYHHTTYGPMYTSQGRQWDSHQLIYRKVPVERILMKHAPNQQHWLDQPMRSQMDTFFGSSLLQRSRRHNCSCDVEQRPLHLDIPIKK
jgi:hypothetical protein